MLDAISVGSQKIVNAGARGEGTVLLAHADTGAEDVSVTVTDTLRRVCREGVQPIRSAKVLDD